MRVKIDKDCISVKTDTFIIFYLWWGIDPWWECKKVKERIIEFGIGYWAWELFKWQVK